MNKFAKGLLLTLVLAAPVAIIAPAVQAKTVNPAKTTLMAAKPTAATPKAGKVNAQRHHKHHAKHSTHQAHKA